MAMNNSFEILCGALYCSLEIVNKDAHTTEFLVGNFSASTQPEEQEELLVQVAPSQETRTQHLKHSVSVYFAYP